MVQQSQDVGTVRFLVAMIEIISIFGWLVVRFNNVSLSVAILTAYPMLLGFPLGRDTVHTIRELQEKSFGSRWVGSTLLHCLVRDMGREGWEMRRDGGVGDEGRWRGGREG